MQQQLERLPNGRHQHSDQSAACIESFSADFSSCRSSTHWLAPLTSGVQRKSMCLITCFSCRKHALPHPHEYLPDSLNAPASEAMLVAANERWSFMRCSGDWRGSAAHRLCCKRGRGSGPACTSAMEVHGPQH